MLTRKTNKDSADKLTHACSRSSERDAQMQQQQQLGDVQVEQQNEAGLEQTTQQQLLCDKRKQQRDVAVNCATQWSADSEWERKKVSSGSKNKLSWRLLVQLL